MKLAEKIEGAVERSGEMDYTNLKAKDYGSDQEVRWCPGCGDYSILKQVQTVMANLALDKDNTVFISGIGCSSRFPYYMDTYGIHSIHGRAPSLATGLKITRPELDIWLITGDGDALSIGGNHTIHLFRRNVNLNMLLFNNQIYGLTKGQYSPTSERGKITKSTPDGSADEPFNPLSLALGAGASFVARSVDRNPKHLQTILTEGHKHLGTSFIEIYQNCNVFNDGAFFKMTNKESKAIRSIYLEEGKPLVFGEENEFGIALDGLEPIMVNLKNGRASREDLWIHDELDKTKAFLLAQLFNKKEDKNGMEFPRPFGIIFKDSDRLCYEDIINGQSDEKSSSGAEPDMNKIIGGSDTWEIK